MTAVAFGLAGVVGAAGIGACRVGVKDRDPVMGVMGVACVVVAACLGIAAWGLATSSPG